MDYEYYYDNAKSRYYNACSEINSCENRINELNRQKWYKMLQINQLKADIRNNQDALSGVEQIIRKDTNLNQKFLKIKNTTDQAAENYISMISSENVSNKNLNDVYATEMSNTKNTLDYVFDTLRNKKNSMDNRIADLRNQLHNAESEYQSIERAIRSTEEDLQEWIQIRRSASYDMEYYRRKMYEAG